MSAINQAALSPQEKIFNLLSGFWLARSIYLAAKLGIADLLNDRPKAISDLAAETHCDARSLYRLMRVLASQGIFDEVSDRCFALTPLGATLQSDTPNSLRYTLMTEMGPAHSIGWGNGLHSLKTGEIAFDAATGMSIWEYFAQHTQDEAAFSQSVSNLGLIVNQAIVASYDFSGFDTLVDVGGAQGSLLTAILQANPHLKGILYDLPTVLENTTLSAVGDHVEIQTGDFFESVTSGGDGYMMRWIMHDWNDEKASLILKNCYEAMPSHGKLLLFESLILPGDEPSFVKFADVVMMIMTGGQERTEVEFRSLLRANGFELTRVIPTPSLLSIIEAVKLP